MDIIEIVNQIAHIAHQGQTRRDGETPYITHPIAVRNYVLRAFKEYDASTNNIQPGTINNLIHLILNNNKYGLNLGELREMTQAIALAHDTKEDNEKITDETFIIEFSKNNIPQKKVKIFLESLDVITKPEGEFYLPYILRVKDNPVTRIVKFFDITHNFGGLHPAVSFNKMNTYQLAKYILLN